MPTEDPTVIGVGAATGSGIIAWLLARVFKMGTRITELEAKSKTDTNEHKKIIGNLDKLLGKGGLHSGRDGARVSNLETKVIEHGLRLQVVESKMDDVHTGVTDLVKNLIEKDKP